MQENACRTLFFALGLTLHAVIRDKIGGYMIGGAMAPRNNPMRIRENMRFSALLGGISERIKYPKKQYYEYPFEYPMCTFHFLNIAF